MSAGFGQNISFCQLLSGSAGGSAAEPPAEPVAEAPGSLGNVDLMTSGVHLQPAEVKPLLGIPPARLTPPTQGALVFTVGPSADPTLSHNSQTQTHPCSSTSVRTVIDLTPDL